MKRPQIGLRLLLLVVTLSAAVFAWLGAVRSRQVAEQAMKRINVEADLRSQERWRATLQGELQVANSPSYRGAVASQIPLVEARITRLRSQLK